MMQPDPFDESTAIELDQAEPLSPVRDRFFLPDSPVGDGSRAVYMCGNSLGCQPKGVREALGVELDDWARLGVEGHLDGRNPWLHYHERFREQGARLVGANPGEVVMMNSLTVNLHLLMSSFYRPTAARFKIVIEDDAFSSDSYAVQSQAALHGFDPAEAVIRLRPRDGESTLRTADIIERIEREGDSIALVMLGGVNYYTGQWFEMEPITRAAKAKGCVVGWDLAHAAGNVPVRLHEWDVDFAAWCSYKYLNAGPGAIAGAFVHERHGARTDLVRMAGWWGNDPSTRFKMDKVFAAREGADGWQLSNPPIFAMTPLAVSLEIFDEIGIGALRDRSLRLTGYLERVIDGVIDGSPGCGLEIITPRETAQRGCQISLRTSGDLGTLASGLLERGVIADKREPDVIRLAPVPLYNSFHDVWRFGVALRDVVSAG